MCVGGGGTAGATAAWGDNIASEADVIDVFVKYCKVIVVMLQMGNACGVFMS